MAERWNAPAVPKTREGALALMPDDEAWRRDWERALGKTAKQPAAHPLSWLPTAPGMGPRLSLVRLYARHDIGRVPRVQECASAARLVTGRPASAGHRLGTSGKHIGNAPLTWACSDAATLCLHNHPNGQKRLTRVEHTPGQGTALTSLAPPLARAVYDRLTRNTACEREHF